MFCDRKSANIRQSKSMSVCVCVCRKSFPLKSTAWSCCYTASHFSIHFFVQNTQLWFVFARAKFTIFFFQVDMLNLIMDSSSSTTKHRSQAEKCVLESIAKALGFRNKCVGVCAICVCTRNLMVTQVRWKCKEWEVAERSLESWSECVRMPH